MLGVRLGAGVSAAAFAILAVVLAAADLVAWREAVAAGLAALTAFLPSAWLAPAGFRRRTAELALLPPAFALTLLADPTQRALALPPLLLLAALAALLAARSRVAVARQPLLLASFALSLVAATSLSLTGFPTWRTVLAALLPPLLSWVVTARLGFEAALVVTLLTAPLPWVRWPLATALALLLATAAAATPRRRPATCNPRPEWLPKVAWSWLGGALALALLAAVLAPYGLLPPYLAFPNAAWFVVPLVATTLLLAPHPPPPAAAPPPPPAPPPPRPPPPPPPGGGGGGGPHAPRAATRPPARPRRAGAPPRHPPAPERAGAAAPPRAKNRVHASSPAPAFPCTPLPRRSSGARDGGDDGPPTP